MASWKAHLTSVAGETIMKLLFRALEDGLHYHQRRSNWSIASQPHSLIKLPRPVINRAYLLKWTVQWVLCSVHRKVRVSESSFLRPFLRPTCWLVILLVVVFVMCLLWQVDSMEGHMNETDKCACFWTECMLHMLNYRHEWKGRLHAIPPPADHEGCNSSGVWLLSTFPCFLIR